MDKTKASIGFVLAALVVYAFYRNYQTGKQSGKNDQLPAQSEMQYYQTPPTVSATGSPGAIHVNDQVVSPTITNQTAGKIVMYNGQPQTYPMV